MAAVEDDPLVLARERERALDLFIAGKNYRYIAADLGRSVATAHKRVQDALNGACKLKAAEYVAAELEFYQHLQDRLMQRLAAGVPPERVVPHLLQVSDRRRRLIGLDAPTRSRVEVDTTAAPDVAFARVVEEAQRMAAPEDAAAVEESVSS